MRTAMRRGIVAVLAGAAFLSIVTSASADAIAPETARSYMEDVGNRTVDLIKSRAGPEDRMRGFVKVMLDSLDFDSIGMASIGRLSRSATPEQKREFTPLFAAYVIDFAIEKFGNLDITKFGLGRAVQQPNGDAKVYTRIDVGDQPMEVYWRVHGTPNGPKINDIELAGASLTIAYRGDFERSGVATVPQLLARLKEVTRGSRSLPMTQQALRQ
ncbi:MAG: ABC transporter substrate-binding protein [Alphaproteobacteria bacterium]|nr:ABC transporter substrate-binding protein [Alphaproteobacteria bacterium]